MADITVSLPDGSAREMSEGTTAADLAAAIGPRLAKAAVIAEVNGVERDLGWPLADGDTVAIVTEDSERGLYTIRHSTAHVLAQAVLDLFDGATFAIGPPIEDGFYYDFALADGATFNLDDLERIEHRMREIVADAQPFVRDEIASDAARKVFADHPFKLEIIDGEAEDPTSATEAGLVRTYENPPSFIDLCRGPHVAHTARLGHFRLTRVAGAYWRGDERRPMLQRIYGTAWATKRDLEDHLHRLEEAERRDHRRLGVDLDLFHLPPEIGAGLPVFHPKGGLVRKLMEDYSRAEHEKAGYEFVWTPHLAKAELFETSGHLEWYADGMYPPLEMEGATYYPKPMNCPMHMLIYRSRQRSYKELPLRLFELGTVYRWERSGVVHGLTRARGFTQDDSHIFCAPDQLADELASLLAFVLRILRTFGLTDFEAELSTRDPEKFIGEIADWDDAEDALRQALDRDGLPYVVGEGEAAFYAPKIDIHVRDAIGRRWQLSTLQVDFQLAPRFSLSYVAPDGSRQPPRVIHRALFGSFERFFAILLEHHAGAFPTWLAPVQARLLPVRDDHEPYARRLADRLRAECFRADLDDATDKLGARIRKAKLEKIPYVLVVGDDDVDAGTVGVNTRGGGPAEVERGVGVDDFVARLRSEVLAQAS